MEKAAGSQNLEVGGKGAWVSREDSLAGVELTGPAIMGELFGLADKEASGVLEDPQGFVVAQVQAIQPPRTLPFEDVKDKVQGEYKAAQSAVLAREKGTELLKKAREQKSLETAAKEMGLQSQQSEWFSRREPAKGLKLTGEALNTALQLGEATPFPDNVLETGNRALVCQLLGRKAPDRSLEKERDSIRKRIEQQKQTMIWQGWLEDQRKKAQVEIYKDL
jgi:peptidyl-prolyl cis-trans isomerase D